MPTPFHDIDLSHHAYVIVGGAATREGLISHLAKKHKIRMTGNPDFYDRQYETFAIDDAREVKSLAETRPANEGAYKVFVLTMNAITVEAQNALLKLLEEPPEYARFFLIMPSAHLLLPTVRSRVRISGGTGGVGTGGDGASSAGCNVYVTSLAKEFLAAPTAKRLEIVKTLMDDIAKEKKTKQDAIDLLAALEEAVHSGAKGAAGRATDAAMLRKKSQALDAILLAGKYAGDRAPSLKMLLEYVALNVV